MLTQEIINKLKNETESRRKTKTKTFGRILFNRETKNTVDELQEELCDE